MPHHYFESFAALNTTHRVQVPRSDGWAYARADGSSDYLALYPGSLVPGAMGSSQVQPQEWALGFALRLPARANIGTQRRIIAEFFGAAYTSRYYVRLLVSWSGENEIRLELYDYNRGKSFTDSYFSTHSEEGQWLYFEFGRMGSDDDSTPRFRVALNAHEVVALSDSRRDLDTTLSRLNHIRLQSRYGVDGFLFDDFYLSYNASFVGDVRPSGPVSNQALFLDLSAGTAVKEWRKIGALTDSASLRGVDGAFTAAQENQRLLAPFDTGALTHLPDDGNLLLRGRGSNPSSIVEVVVVKAGRTHVLKEVEMGAQEQVYSIDIKTPYEALGDTFNLQALRDNLWGVRLKA